jgi:hypothetical protein
MLRKASGRAPRLRLAKLLSLFALLLSLIGLSSLKRGRRSDCGVVAGETRPTIHRHGDRSLRLRTLAISATVACQTPAGAGLVNSGDRRPLRLAAVTPPITPTGTRQGSESCLLMRTSRIQAACLEQGDPGFESWPAYSALSKGNRARAVFCPRESPQLLPLQERLRLSESAQFARIWASSVSRSERAVAVFAAPIASRSAPDN